MDPAAAFFVIAVVLVIALFFFVNAANARAKEKRRAALMLKYRDAALVESIMGKMLWQGQTEEMLLDSMGQPEDVDRKVLKTKSKEVWKYGRVGQNRFRTRVTLENRQVVGWDLK